MNPGPKGDFYRWKPAAALRISGEDSPSFLQGQFTNDLHKQGMGGAVYGLWLNQKGKVLADSFVLQIAAQEFWVVSYFSPAAVIRERLEAYVIADDVVIEDRTDGMAGLTVFGPAAPADALPAGARSFPGRRTREPHTEVIFPVGAEAATSPSLASVTSLSPVEMERRRIMAGIPAVPADIGPADLPNEGGLETEAISYTKGCYLGQEVMARLKSMGKVRRQLLRVRGEEPLPVLPAPLFQAGRKVGEVRSAMTEGAGWLGLAMISLLQVRRTDGLALAAEGVPTVVFSEES
jgi:folate-binding protein YgfZ